MKRRKGDLGCWNIMYKGSVMMTTRDKKKPHAVLAGSNGKHGHMKEPEMEGRDIPCSLESHIKEWSLPKNHWIFQKISNATCWKKKLSSSWTLIFPPLFPIF